MNHHPPIDGPRSTSPLSPEVAKELSTHRLPTYGGSSIWNVFLVWFDKLSHDMQDQIITDLQYRLNTRKQAEMVRAARERKVT